MKNWIIYGRHANKSMPFYFFAAERGRKAALKLSDSEKQQVVFNVDICNNEKRSLHMSKNRYYNAPETKIVCR